MVVYYNSPLMDIEFLKKLYAQKQKEVYAKIVALNWNEEIIEEITGSVTQGSISIDGNSAVRRTCSLSMVVKDQKITDATWALKTKFKLYSGLINNIEPNYPNVIWIPHGLFLITSFSKSKATNNYTVNINGKDKMALLDGSLGGSITASSVDFGTVEKYDNKTEIRTVEKLKLKDIIKEAVHEYAREPFHNIIIEDLDKDGLELLEYRGTDPLYLINLKEENEIYNISTNGKTKVYIKQGDIFKETTLDSDEIIYDFRISTLTDSTDAITTIYLEKNENKPCTIIKIEYGDTAGYRLTDLVYSGDLIANVGSSITSGVLDKIKQMLGEYEYFYDIDGKFIFRKKAIYINTSWTPIEGAYIENNMYEFPYEYSLDNNEVISAFSTNPDISNVKNDFSIWGTRTSVSGAELPVHLRFAIDKKPVEYVTYGNIKYVASDNYEVSEDEKTIKCDWRELIYQMALDYRKHYHDNDFLGKIAENNPKYYPTGNTGYELYYTDLEAFWRQIYNPQAVWEPSQMRSLGEVTSQDLIKQGDDKWADVKAINTMQLVNNSLDNYKVENLYKKLSADELKQMSYSTSFTYSNSNIFLRHPMVSSFTYYLKNNSEIELMTPSSISIKDLNNDIDGYLTFSYNYPGTASSPYYFIEEANINKSQTNYQFLMKISIIDISDSNKNKILYIGLDRSDIKDKPTDATTGSTISFDRLRTELNSSLDFKLIGWVEEEKDEDGTIIKEAGFKSFEEYFLDKDFFGPKVKIFYSSIFDRSENIFIKNYVNFNQFNLNVSYKNNVSEEDVANADRVYVNVYDMIDLWSDIYDFKNDDDNYVFDLYYKDYNNNFQLVRKSVETSAGFSWNSEKNGWTTSTDQSTALQEKIILKGTTQTEEESYSVYGLLENGGEIFIGSFYLPKRNWGASVTNIEQTYTYNGSMYVYSSANWPHAKVSGIKKERFTEKTEFFNFLLKNNLDKSNLYYSLAITSENQGPEVFNLEDFAKQYAVDRFDIYYLETDLWKDLIQNKEYKIVNEKIEIFDSYLTLSFDKYGTWTGGNFISLTPSLRAARYNEVDEFHINYASKAYGWHINVVDNPSQLNFWFDFLDNGGEIEKYATYNMGNRPKATNDDKVKAIYFKEIPNIIYAYDISKINSQDWSGYTKVSISETLESMFSISSQGKSAKDVLDESLYNNTYAIENVSITSIPIYTLQPNTRIKIIDDKENLNSEYVVSKLTVPLTYNGTMSITANKLADSIL